MKAWLLLGALLGTLAPDLAAAQRHARLISRVDSLAGAALKRGPVPGLSIAILRDNDTILARGYGYASIEDSVPATAYTVYRIASITKVFTAAAVLRLSQAERLRLRDTVTKFLPPYAVADKQITVRHLLGHTSGIRPLDGLDREGSILPASPDDVVRYFAQEPPELPPGQRFSYSNTGYYLLGIIIERASGLPYFEYLQSEVFDSAGLTATGDCGRWTGGIAQGYKVRDSGLVPVDELETGPAYAAGGLCSTALDLAHALRALRDRKVINALSWRQMIEPVELEDGSRASYGYGLMLGTLGKHRSVSHGGAWPGFASHLVYFPEARLSISLLANAPSAPLRRLADQVARAALGLVEPVVKDLPLRADHVSRYEGTFDLDGVPLRIYAENGSLHARLGDGDGLRLLFQGGTEFAADADPSLRFLFRVSRGSARSVLFRAGGLDAVARRIPQEQ